MQNDACISSAEQKEQGTKAQPKGNVPALRFPGFTDNWERVRLGNMCEVQMCKRIMASQTNPSVGVPFYKIGTIGGVPDAYISYELFEEYKNKYNYPHKGEVLITCAGTVGKCLLYDGEDSYYQDSNIVWLRNNSTKLDNGFLFNILSNINWSRLNSTTIVRIYNDNLRNLQFHLPSLEEQKKIVKSLNAIDERIATQNKIIEKLQSLIKGLVDSLLENPSWEKVYLRSFMQFYSTNSLSWEQLSYSNGNVRNLHYGLIHGFQTSMIDSTLLPRILPNYQPKQYTVCQDGDVAFADASEDTNEIGKAIEFSNTIDVKTVCGLHTIHGRDIKQNTILGFKGFAFNSRYFHDQVRRLAQGTKVYSITAKNLSSCYVYIPDMIKQENVVRLLNAYEENLSLNRTLLNKYEIQKQYLLQQMLI